ncbi:MAG: PEGA domain-containing protein [Deltaproteobacteria bacterium]|nr:PEGA domain-containing protein [Deltaproteobacteria bacterium]
MRSLAQSARALLLNLLAWSAALPAAVVVVPPSARADELVPVAVMDLVGRGVDEAAVGALTTEVSNTIAAWRIFRVITREDVKRMLQLEETRQQCSGDVNAQCMAEIGGALGVEYLVHGELSRVGGTYSVSLVLLDIARAEAKNRVSRKVSEPRRLLEETSTAVKMLMAPLLEDKRGFLVVSLDAVGAQVSVDGRTVGISPLGGRLELGMGAHEVRVAHEGFMDWAQTVEILPGQVSVADVRLVPSQGYIDAYEARASRTRAFAWVAAGTSVALVGTGVVLRVVDNAKFRDLVDRGYLTQDGSCAASDPGFEAGDYCPTGLGYEHGVLDEISSIERLDTVATGLIIAGGVSAVLSVYWFFSGDSPGRYSAYSVGAAQSGIGGQVFIDPRGQVGWTLRY